VSAQLSPSQGIATGIRSVVGLPVTQVGVNLPPGHPHRSDRHRAHVPDRPAHDRTGGCRSPCSCPADWPPSPAPCSSPRSSAAARGICGCLGRVRRSSSCGSQSVQCYGVTVLTEAEDRVAAASKARLILAPPARPSRASEPAAATAARGLIGRSRLVCRRFERASTNVLEEEGTC